MTLHNPKNWHFVSKNVQPWATKWFEQSFKDLEATEGDVTAKITGIRPFDEEKTFFVVQQKKGIVNAIYDFTVSLEYTGKVGDGSDVTGTIDYVEVGYQECDEADITSNVTSSTASKDSSDVQALVKSKIVPQVNSKLFTLSKVLKDEHGKDIQHTEETDPSNRLSTPKYIPQTKPKPANSSTVTKKSSDASIPNTTTVTHTMKFPDAPVDIVFKILTDPETVGRFTRGPIPYKKAEEGVEYSLFGGNVRCKYVMLQPPKKIVQKWRLNDTSTWKADHFSTQTIDLKQDGNTAVMDVTWEGIPVGQESITRENWKEKYLQAIQQSTGVGMGFPIPE